MQKQLDDLDREYVQLKTKVEQQRSLIASEKQKGTTMRAQVEEKKDLVASMRQSLEGAMNERISMY